MAERWSISDALFWKYRGTPELGWCLIELDRDHAQGKVRSAREYARLWDISRRVVDRLLSEFRAEMGTRESVDSVPATRQRNAGNAQEIAADGPEARHYLITGPARPSACPFPPLLGGKGAPVAGTDRIASRPPPKRPALKAGELDRLGVELDIAHSIATARRRGAG
jgi:hypothetical protein